jgi:hypothetical protein
MSESAPPVRQFLFESLTALAGVAVLAWAWRADLRWCERHLLLWYWAYDPSQVVIARRWRIAALVVGLTILLVMRPLVGRWALRRSIPDCLGGILRIGVSLLLSLVAGEVALRVLKLPRSETSPNLVQVRIGEENPRVGWLYRPSRSTTIESGGRSIEYAINSDRNRAAATDAAPDRDRPTLLFVGESVTVGHGLKWEETYPALVGKALDLQVVNLAVHGYGADQAFLRFVDELPKYRHPVAVVSFFIPSVIERLSRYDHPHIVFDGVEPRVVPTDGAWDQLRIFRLSRELVEYHTDETFALAAQIFRETARRAAERGASALFVAPGIGYVPPRGDRYVLDELFTRQGLACVDTDIGFEPQPGDWHPNAHATSVLADAVTSALRAEIARR